MFGLRKNELKTIFNNNLFIFLQKLQKIKFKEIYHRKLYIYSIIPEKITLFLPLSLLINFFDIIKTFNQHTCTNIYL